MKKKIKLILYSSIAIIATTSLVVPAVCYRQNSNQAQSIQKIQHLQIVNT